jgi:hypothetical protein
MGLLLLWSENSLHQLIMRELELKEYIETRELK